MSETQRIYDSDPKTIRDFILKHMVINGMFADQATVVLSRYSTGDGWGMDGRWDDAIDGYPETLLAVLLVGINAEAVKWIDENLPKAWFRSMFVRLLVGV